VLRTLAPILRAIFRRADRPLYTTWAAVSTLVCARAFYGFMLKQTGGEWSAPLDDVFIHFDYARATAHGHPFEWTVGNGYSSGNTSLTYPFVLAVGWLVGFTGRFIIIWAAIVAEISVFGMLLAVRRLFIEGPHDDWGRASSYLLPPILLGVGALDWSLWSGMEVAFFLATWSLALVAWTRLERDARAHARPARASRSAWLLGLAGALMVVTRPEAALTIGIFGVAAAHAHRRSGARRMFWLLTRAGLPSVVVLVLQTIANRAFTGEWSANGAIVKLALNSPYMTSADKFADWFGNAQYASLRNLDYHFAHIEGEAMSHLLDPPGADETFKRLLWAVTQRTGLGRAFDATHITAVYTYLARTMWWAGVLPLAVAFLPLMFGRTRRIALVVWLQIVAWVLVVALNGQVRWQNERYVMPAVAWMLVMTALGISVVFRARAGRRGTLVANKSGGPMRPGPIATIVLGAIVAQVIGVLTRPPGPPHFRLSWLLALACGAAGILLLRYRTMRGGIAIALVLFMYDHQVWKMRDQRWFFGRASRNIRDQHLTVGKFLKTTDARRVLVGDAGAIIFESERPGLDVIGLGGYKGLPFARASVHGLPATLELVERIPMNDRPDVFAIFPTWWGVLPLWFAQGELGRFPVEGNVICGGYEKIVYKADWSLLNTGSRIRRLPKGEKVRVDVDVADLVSEAENGYVFDAPANGWTDMRVLPDPDDSHCGMFDAGRRIAASRFERFFARGLVPLRVAHLVVRTAPESKTTVRVALDGFDVGTLGLERTGGWVEKVLELPANRISGTMNVLLTNEGPGDFVDFHTWVTQ